VPRALIIGGGIGGLTAAVALRRKGWDAHVYEAAPALRPVGKGIWVPTNAMQVLDRLGLAAAVAAAGWALERIQVGTTAGTILMDFDLSRAVAKYGHSTVSIHRAMLVDVLAGALPPDALHLGRQCVGLEQNADGVTARFASGEQARGDVLIGADGIHSAVREKLFPGVKLRYSGQTCYRGIADMELPAGLARTCREVWGGKARFGFSAVGLRQVYWFAPVTAPAGSADAVGSLSDLYAHFPEPIPEIVRRTPAAEIIRTDLFDFPTLDRWWQGRVALLGDAAHAMTPNLGQGGAQAIEDAYVLAEQLAAQKDVAAAFQEYERLRLPKVRWVAQTAWRIGRLAHVANPWLRRLRDLALRATPAGMNERQFDRLYALNY
jgi:2-polyprenyl-6-methoxyphenol hydroxylase-like FAD-dependent oxidoreductase